MRTFLVLICSFALPCVVHGDTEKKQTSQTSHHQATHEGHPSSGNKGAQGRHEGHPSSGNKGSQGTQASQHAEAPKSIPPAQGHPSGFSPAGQPRPSERAPGVTAIAPVQPAAPPAVPRTQQEANEDYAHSQGFRSHEQYQKWKETGRIEGTSGVVRPWHAQHFDLPPKSDPAVEGVKFQGDGHIVGSEIWTGEKYAAFRDYRHEWHDKDWWEQHHPSSPAPSASPKSSLSPKPSTSPKPSASPKPSGSPKPSPTPKPSPCPTPSPSPTSPPITTFVLISGGYYYRNGCYWYPAWGYDPNYSYYPYDGPIYSCILPPDQMIANLQTRLKELGYYDGPINGLLGPATRAAIANYQYDRGLYATSAIDQATLESLGVA